MDTKHDGWSPSNSLLLIALFFTISGCQNDTQQGESNQEKDTSNVEVKRFLDSFQKKDKSSGQKTVDSRQKDINQNQTPTRKKDNRSTDSIKQKDSVNSKNTPLQGKKAANIKSSEDSNVIEIGYVNWTEGIAMTHLAEAILEDKMGYTVHKRLGYVGQVLDSLAWGTNDIFLDHWMAKDTALGEKSDIVDLGVNFKGARMGLVVPQYMNIQSIDSLNAIKDKTNKRIVGIDAGADIMEKTRKAMKSYDLDYQLSVSSGPGMTRQLKNAIDNKQPIIVTGWTPHWKFSRFDLKFLKDRKGVYGTTKNIHTLARKGFEEDHPEITRFLKNFSLNEKELGNLIEKFAASNNWDKAVEEWMNNNQVLVKKWLKNQPEI